ncbi:efflux RND transporter periplasmic adaptor subunit [Oceanibacterium hippocampi]|uniref:Multidrug resistance protein MdtE n=1 Tax=Oceanibacterium hippocampi TaxID=745714 RepID=A0A1Y5TZJ1_9PROT|nr:efflux RND transporter periplasmic adaptor subunit [Oceanibacterium hippocampi]SLN76766.1 Multidrug resistance protein MdtE precursor [Oceanibacterium hippocampi]
MQTLITTPASGRRERNSRVTPLGVALFAMLIGIQPAGAQQQAPAVTVATPLARELVEYDDFTGQFAAVESVEIRSRVSGYLQSINFQDGQIVRKGDLLFQIDPRPFEAELASAKARLAQAEAQVELANQQLKRAEQLRKNDFVSRSAYDERMAELRVASGAAEIARAEIRSVALDVEFARILSPIDGRISRHEVSVGNLVTGGAAGTPTLLTTIVSIDPIHFVFDMSETDFLAYQRAVAKGLLKSQRDAVEVYARLADEPDWPRVGTLDYIDNRVDRTSGTIRVRAVFPNPDGFLTPGQFGRIRIPGSEPYTALLIPESAVLSDQSQKIVMVLGENNVVQARIVRLGPTYDGLRIVRAGLEPDDRIVIAGLMRIRAGATVTPEEGVIEGIGEKRPG